MYVHIPSPPKIHETLINTTRADAPEKIDYAINRYQTETKRLYQVLNDRLAAQRATHSVPDGEAAYLVGNKYTLSDICVCSWVNWGEWAGVEPSAFPEIKT